MDVGTAKPRSTLLPVSRRATAAAAVVIGERGERLGHAAGVHLGVVEDAHLGEVAALHDAADEQGKRLLNVDLEAGARLHEAASALAGPVEAHGGGHGAALLQVALVARDDFDGGDDFAAAGSRSSGGVCDAGFSGPFRIVQPRLGFHVNQVIKVLQRVEGVARGDVVDEKKGVGAEVGGRPHAAVLLLAGGVGEGEVVGGAVDAAGDGVVVLNGRVVLGGPLGTDEAESDGGLAAAAIAADGNGDGDGRRGLLGGGGRCLLHLLLLTSVVI